MMETTESLPPVRKSDNVVMRVINFLSSLGLATTLLVILGVLTWLATLEQIEFGLYPTLNKYFDWKAWYVMPDLPELRWFNENPVTLPLPGGYWVCVLLVVNLTLGGIIRMRKGWKKAGILIAHFGIIFMLVGGGVTDHFSERGSMAILEGQSSDVAVSFQEWVVEVAEIKSDKPEDIHVIRGDHLTDLEGANSRVFRLPNLPFDLEVSGYFENAGPVSVDERAPSGGRQSFDGYYIVEKPDKDDKGEAVKEELKTAAAHARALFRDGKKSDPFILAGASFHPFTLTVDGRVFTVDMVKRRWPMPFTVRLDKFTAAFHPGTSRPSKFISEITRIEKGSEAKAIIEMNEPMRYEGLTFFQTSYEPGGPGGKFFSVFEIVKNPADKWPEYSLWVVSIGLFIQFVTKLVIYLMGSSRRKSDV